MKKLGVVLFLTLAAVVLLGGNAFAQNVGDNSVYFVTYYANNNYAAAPRAVVRLINDGDNSTTQVEGIPLPGNLWASFYVFDDSQELQECCNCKITADGLLSETVYPELTGNPLNGARLGLEHRGVIKVISSASGDPTNNVLKAGLRGWATHIQDFPGNPGGVAPFYVTETGLADSNLVPAEKAALETSCSYLITLGSGAGICGCTPEDYDF